MYVKPLTEFEMSCLQKLIWKADEESIVDIKGFIEQMIIYREWKINEEKANEVLRQSKIKK